MRLWPWKPAPVRICLPAEVKQAEVRVGKAVYHLERLLSSGPAGAVYDAVRVK